MMTESELPTATTGRAWVDRRFARFARIGVFDGVAILLALVVAGLVLFPMWHVVRRSIFVDGNFTLKFFKEVLDDPTIGTVVRNTAIITSVSTGTAVVLACAFAWFNERTDARLGWLARILPLVSLLIPGAASAFGWYTLLAPRAGSLNVLMRDALSIVGIDLESGPINITSMYGMIFLYTALLMPIAYVVIQPAFQNLDPALEEAARTSGAGAVRTLRKVTLPAILPSIVSAVLLTGVIAVALFSIPLIIGTPAGIPVVSTRMYRYLTYGFPPATGPALALTMFVLAITIAGVMVQRYLGKRQRHAVIVGKRSTTSLVHLGRWRLVARGAMIAYILAAAVVPLLGLVYLSQQRFWSADINMTVDLGAFRRMFQEGSKTRESIINSATLGVLVGTLTVGVSIVIATFVNRSPSATAKMVDGVMKIPATLSHLVLAVGILFAFGRAPFNLAGSKILLVLGLFIAYLPLASFAATAAMTQISNELTEAAAVSGARPGRTFRKVQLPLLLPSLIGGWSLVFVACIGDITVSALLSANNSQVVGFRMIDLQTQGLFPELAALGVIMTITSATVVTATIFLFNRGGLNVETGGRP